MESVWLALSLEKGTSEKLAKKASRKNVTEQRRY